jgi:hypothetical protein
MKRPEDFVCPEPKTWNEIYGKLCDIAKQRGLPKPPIPLILAAWWDTPAMLKMIRWRETREWAEKYGLRNEIPELREDQKHHIGN